MNPAQESSVSDVEKSDKIGEAERAELAQVTEDALASIAQRHEQASASLQALLDEQASQDQQASHGEQGGNHEQGGHQRGGDNRGGQDAAPEETTATQNQEQA